MTGDDGGPDGPGDDAGTEASTDADAGAGSAPGTEGGADRGHERSEAAEPEPGEGPEAGAGGDGPGSGRGPERLPFDRTTPGRWWPYVALSAGLFAAGAAAGAAVASVVDVSALAALAEGTSSALPDELTTVTIAANNLLALAVHLGGAVSFGVLGAVGLLLNGALLGFVGALAAGRPVFLVAAVLPHAVLELPAFWLAAAVGFRVTRRLVRYLRGIDATVYTRAELVETAALVALAAVAIVVAAWVEATVTPVVVEALTGVEVG